LVQKLQRTKMNIKQAKQRFTELTGLPAIGKAVFPGIWQLGGKVGDWSHYAWDNDYCLGDNFDARKADYWVSVVRYLEALQEIA
jgi:hypothetical protein